jgi:phosphatidylglycerol:prolipoprotein diacylglycerol transferase
MGQWLTIPLMIIGLALVINALIRPPLGTHAAKPAAA